MLIWMGKQHLKQKDRDPVDVGDKTLEPEPLTINFSVAPAKADVRVTNAKD